MTLTHYCDLTPPMVNGYRRSESILRDEVMWSELPDRLKATDEHLFASAVRIAASHRCCEQLGLPRDIRYPRDVCSMDEIAQTDNRQEGLIEFSKLLFASTFDRLTDKRVLFALTDARARIVALHSNPVVVRAAADQQMCLGTSVAESSIGTNAVSLALRDMQPTILHGDQHYCEVFHNWCCIAIPLTDARGSPIGCLDISMSHESSVGEKFALASFVARELGAFSLKVSVPAPVPDNETLRVDGNQKKVHLTERQREVLELFSQGLTYKKIARHLQLQSSKTVQEHMDVVRTKLHATSRRDCIRIAVKQGLLGA